MPDGVLVAPVWNDVEMTDSSLTESTWFIDADSAEVGRFVDDALDGVPGNDPTAAAVALFRAVRDGVRYDPYEVSRDPADYRASSIVGTASNWCVPKAVLLTAAARRAGIAARLGFADVRNHFSSSRLQVRRTGRIAVVVQPLETVRRELPIDNQRRAARVRSRWQHQ